MGCATNIVKYLFFVFNLLFWILGIVVIAIGIYSRVENDTWKDLIDSNTILEAANLLIAAGIIVAVIGFLGCCGAIKKFQWMLVSYAILVILIFILQIAAGIYAYTKRDTIQKSLTTKLTKGVQINYGKTDTASKGLTKAINWFQENIKCCGAGGPRDWESSAWRAGRNDTTVPSSCCKKSACAQDVVYSSTDIYQSGCVAEGKVFAKKNLWLLGGIGVGVAVAELLGIVFALWLCKTYRDDAKGETA